MNEDDEKRYDYHRKQYTYHMKNGLKEEDYVAGFAPHCIEHCDKLAFPEGMPLIRKVKPCINHELENWDDCWECYLESK